VRNILLTGVTGFVGAHLAESILAESGTQLICPVRGESEYTCIARVASSLATHSFWQQKFIHRIRVIPCNLEQPWLGLPQAQLRALLGSVDAVLINAANVHALYSYARLKAVNVGSVRDVLLNSLQESGVPVHFISSLSIFTEQQQERLSEQTVPEVPPTRDGYAQSKWVADRLCLAAARAGAPVSVYRLGEMMSPLRTGLANETALSTHLLSTILKLGAYPEKKVYLDYTPVDVAARIIVRAVLSGMVNKVYHICNTRPLGFDELSAMLATALGRHPPPQAISDQKFLELLRAACRTNPMDKDLRYVAELLPERAPEEGVLATLFTQNSRRCDTLNVNDLMARSGSVWPELSVESLMPTSHFFARRMFNVHAALPAGGVRPLTELA
jgi:thioester reductase-like protein